MLVFFLIIGGLLYLASVYIKQKYGTLDIFVEEAKRKLSGGEDEDKEPGVFEDPNVPPVASNLVAPSPEDPDVEAQEEVPEPTQEQLSKWKELEEMCKPGGLRSIYTGFKVDEETGEFVPEYENIDCCYEQPWENEGECVDGQQKQVRGVLNEDLCEVEPEKEQMLDCCSYGEWENDGDCIDGVQKQKRQIFNPELCVDTTTTREIDCCSYGEWELDGECVDGNQNYKRTIINSELCEDTSLKKTEPCCLPLDWANDGVCKPTGMQDQIRAHINRDLCVGEAEKDYQEVPCCYRDDWQNDGTCDFSEGKINQKRTIKNADICRAEGDAATSQTVDCCYIGPWENDGPANEETGIQKQGRELRNVETCPAGTESTQEIMTCKREKWRVNPAWNNGAGCNAQGKIQEIREIRSMDMCEISDPDEEINALTREVDCCFKGEWVKQGNCGDETIGMQKFVRQIMNPEMCPTDGSDGDVDGNITEKEEPCCQMGDWVIDEDQRKDDPESDKMFFTQYCKPNGKMTKTRTLHNPELCGRDGLPELADQSRYPLKTEEDCCYIPSQGKVIDDAAYLHKHITNAGGSYVQNNFNFALFHNDYTKDKVLEDSVDKRYPFKIRTPVNREKWGKAPWGAWHRYNKIKWDVKNEGLCDANSQQVLDNDGNTMQDLYNNSGAPTSYFSEWVPSLTATDVEGLKYQLEETCQPYRFDTEGKEWALWDRTKEMKQHGKSWGYQDAQWIGRPAYHYAKPANPEIFQGPNGQFSQNKFVNKSRGWAALNGQFCDNTGNVTLKREVRGQNQCKRLVEEGKVPEFEKFNFEPEVNYDCCWIDSDIGSNIEYKTQNDEKSCQGVSSARVQAKPKNAKNIHLCAKGENDYLAWLKEVVGSNNRMTGTWTAKGFIGSAKEGNPWQEVNCGYDRGQQDYGDARYNHDKKTFTSSF
jgi:hypothetical protein